MAAAVDIYIRHGTVEWASQVYGHSGRDIPLFKGLDPDKELALCLVERLELRPGVEEHPRRAKRRVHEGGSDHDGNQRVAKQ
jgi:hypothetical protein